MLMWLRSGSCQNRLNDNAKAAKFYVAYLCSIASKQRLVGTDLSRSEHHYYWGVSLMTCASPGLVVTTLAPMQGNFPNCP